MSTYSNNAFRKSIVQYTVGRALNALCAFIVIIWIARHLPEKHYANYIAAYACLELALVIFGFGMEWVTAVYIPQVKLRASGRVLASFVWSCAGIQMLLLSIGAIALALLASDIATWLQLDEATIVFRLYALVMFVEGLSRVFRDQLLSCLLLQGAAQFSQMARNLVMLAFAFILSTQSQWRTASSLAVAEIFASSLSLLLSAILLHRYLYGIRNTPAQDPHYPPPRWRGLLRAGRNAWISNLANLSWGGQAVILLVTRLIGPESTAALGFARNLAEQIRRYMPMEFLFGVIRPLLITRFFQDGDTQRLSTRAGLMYRANLLFLLPLLVIAIIRGDELCALLSNGRYASAHWLLVGWLVVLVFWAHHRLSDLLAHALERSCLTRQSSLKLLAVPAFLFVSAYHHAWMLLFLSLAAAELAYSIMVLSPLGIYRPNWWALAKLFAAAFLVAALLAVPAWETGVISLAIQIALAFVIIPGISALTRAWSAEEAAIVFPGKALAGAN